MDTDERFPVQELWVDSVGITSIDYDWSEDYPEVWNFFEAPTCFECSGYAEWDSEEHEWMCTDPECEVGTVDPSEDDSLEGPMMNYYYPLPDLRRVGDDPNEAASRINHLPLCVVEFQGGEYALALTGGGMDLSWEICEAFTRLGFLPPLHFCDLPQMAGHEGRTYVIEACKRSAEVAAGQAGYMLARLNERYPALASA